MVEQHESNLAVITGCSTHNERIERMWRDVFRCVGVLFYNTFRQLEDDNEFSTLNEVDMFCLHFVFLKRINCALKSFAESWNNHPISTEHNLTPNELFVEGALQQDASTVPSHPTGVTLPVARDHIQVPRSSFFPCIVLKTHLDQVDQLRDTDNFGIDIYLEVVQVVGQHLKHGCSDCYIN